MKHQQMQVRQFMQAAEQHLEVTPKCPPPDVAKLRKLLVIEECAELVDAIEQENLEKVADNCADVLYVVLGCANAYGFDLHSIFEEVHRSNMTKIGGKKDANGKLIKPSTYSPADIASKLKPW